MFSMCEFIQPCVWCWEQNNIVEVKVVQLCLLFTAWLFVVDKYSNQVSFSNIKQFSILLSPLFRQLILLKISHKNLQCNELLFDH